MNKRWTAHLRSGGRVLVEIATECLGSPSPGASSALEPLSLARKSVRLLAENAAIVAAAQGGDVEVENACERSSDDLSPAA
jgi:hypothetical protein